MKKLAAKSVLLLLTLFFNIFFLSCSENEKELAKTLDKMEMRYENICQELGIAYWNYYSNEAEADLKTPKEKIYSLLVNDTLNILIEDWYPRASEIKDTILRKRVEMWHRVLLSAKVEYDKEVMDLRNELEEMLEVDKKAQKNKNSFEDKMLKLIELRNKKSVELGYDNYAHLNFEANGLGYEWFMNFVDEMNTKTLEPYKILVEEIKTEQNKDQFNQMDAFLLIRNFYGNIQPSKLKDTSNIELVKKSLANIGIDYSELPSELTEMELPAGIGGQGLMINIPNDFRAVMTLGMEISVWMHEMGHGLHGLFNSINEPILEGYEWIPGNSTAAFAEGMAETSAYFTRNNEWLKKYTDLSEQEIIERRKTLNKYAPAFIRFHINSFMRETELYLHPEKSFEEIQKELAKKYLLVDTTNMRTNKLENIIYVSYPLYLQNYLLADIVASQIHTSLEEKFGEDYAFNKEVGEYLAENFYSTGEYFSWNKRLELGTGKPLDIEAYLNYYQIK